MFDRGHELGKVAVADILAHGFQFSEGLNRQEFSLHETARCRSLPASTLLLADEAVGFTGVVRVVYV